MLCVEKCSIKTHKIKQIFFNKTSAQCTKVKLDGRIHMMARKKANKRPNKAVARENTLQTKE